MQQKPYITQDRAKSLSVTPQNCKQPLRIETLREAKIPISAENSSALLHLQSEQQGEE